ncbi:hypothetical protein BDK51DRAFT_37765 [Blyttiomyces helicus]|uniref:Tyrosine-protein kinase ephrin type A/B receptor-like domain-containing protein n=1 Tax=Blyttiomyces helicus TaxID=388810 RepID=A0A4P9W1S3_9FUNG|nr:hypothetical protein BDK51DRAFT_37765 [Blyttiomyces helicus]|eukprot:RKO84530.1 hypothetical protein BDK51DRAFT_37765 [Blyttiomyces helicus]
MFSLLTVNETVNGIIMATGPLLVNLSSIPHELRLIANDSTTAFPLDIPRTILVMFHQPEPFTDKAVTVGAIQDAAARFRYSVTMLLDVYQEAQQIGKLEAALKGCSEGVANGGCPSALITTNPSAGFVEAAAAIAASAGIPYVESSGLYFVSGDHIRQKPSFLPLSLLPREVIGLDRANLSLPVHLWIGNDNLITGYDAGNFLIDRGANYPLCLVPSQDEEYLLLCRGMANAFSATVVNGPVTVDAFNDSQGVTSILEILQVAIDQKDSILRGRLYGEHQSFDSVMCTYPSLCTALFAAIDSNTPGIKVPVQVVSIGVDPTTVDFLIDGRIGLAIETAPYLQVGAHFPSLHFIYPFDSAARTESPIPLTGFHGDDAHRVIPRILDRHREPNAAMYARLPSGAMGLSSTCTPCSPNTFAAEGDARKCLPCPSGTFANGTGAMRCQSCADGIGVDPVGALVNVTGTEQIAACASFYRSQQSPPASSRVVKVFGGIGAALVVGSSVAVFALRHEPLIKGMTVDVAGFVPFGALLVVTSILLLQGVLDLFTCTCAIILGVWTIRSPPRSTLMRPAVGFAVSFCGRLYGEVEEEQPGP